MILSIPVYELTEAEAEAAAHVPTAEVQKDLDQLVGSMRDLVSVILILQTVGTSFPPWNPYCHDRGLPFLAVGYVMVEELEDCQQCAGYLQSLLLYRKGKEAT
jgi:hypothetical protein